MKFIKSLIVSSLLSVLPAHAHATPTEIQMFVNYSGVNHYSLKIVSTPSMPTSAYYIYVGRGDTPTTAACYVGDPRKAFRLLKTMVRIFNEEYHHSVRILGGLVPHPETGAPALRIDALESGQIYPWFSAMGPCWRAASESEKHPTH